MKTIEEKFKTVLKIGIAKNGLSEINFGVENELEAMRLLSVILALMAQNNGFASIIMTAAMNWSTNQEEILKAAKRSIMSEETDKNNQNETAHIKDRSNKLCS